MLALQQCLPVPQDQHRLPVTLDRAAAALMLPLPASCGLQNHINASTYSQRFPVWPCTAEPGFDLFASICRICRKIFRKICRIWQKICSMTKNMQKNMQNMTKNMFKYDKYVVRYIATYCDIFCIFYILQYVQYVQDRPSHIFLLINLHIGLHTAAYLFCICCIFCIL